MYELLIVSRRDQTTELPRAVVVLVSALKKRKICNEGSKYLNKLYSTSKTPRGIQANLGNTACKYCPDRMGTTDIDPSAQ